MKYIKRILEQSATKKMQELNHEVFLAFFLKKSGKSFHDYIVKGVIRLAEGDEYDIEIKPDALKRVYHYYKEYDADALVFMHNHPYINGERSSSLPSEEDIESTMFFKGKSLKEDINFFDHIIVNDIRYFSFLENGIM